MEARAAAAQDWKFLCYQAVVVNSFSQRKVAPDTHRKAYGRRRTIKCWKDFPRVPEVVKYCSWKNSPEVSTSQLRDDIDSIRFCICPNAIPLGVQRKNRLQNVSLLMLRAPSPNCSTC